METTEITEQTNNDQFPPMIITAEAKAVLHTAGRWANFLAIIGFIGAALIGLCALFVGTLFSRLPQFSQSPLPGAAGGMIGFIYILIAVLHFFLAYYLYQFGKKIRKSILYNDSEEAANAFGKLKSLLQLAGIVTIVVISIYVIIIVIVAIIAAIGLSMR